MVFLWSLQTVYGGNDWLVQEINVKKNKGLTCTLTLMPGTHIGLIASCECTHHSQKRKKNKKEWFCISLAVTSGALLFRCSEQLITVSLSYQKQVLFSLQRFAFLFLFENLLQAQKQCVYMLPFLARCKRTQKNGCKVFIYLFIFLTSGTLFQISRPKLDCVGPEASLPFPYRE